MHTNNLIDMKSLHYLVFLGLSLAILSCGTMNHPYYAENNGILEKPNISSEKIYSMFLVGDAGELDDTIRKTNFVLEDVKSKLEKSDKNQGVVFLGDNLYPKGTCK